MATMAGGAGAGGAGAGGAGAGGAGAGGGHVGGPSSSLLNEALTISQDAITGYWNGNADLASRMLRRLPKSGDLTGLDASRRIDMLMAELLRHFDVSGTHSFKDGSGNYTAGEAIVRVNGETLTSLKAPDEALLAHQLIWLRNYSDLRFDRLAEINTQITDLLSFFGAQAQLDAASRKRSMEAMIATQRVAYLVAMQVKSLTWTPRPIDLSSKVQPAIQTPDHSSFPSGHAVEAFALAHLLTRMMGDDPTSQIPTAHLALRLAHRIATNRVVAGVHFPIDSIAGAHLGSALGEAIWAIVSGEDTIIQTSYTATVDTDFLLGGLDLGNTDTQGHAGKRGDIATEFNEKISAEWARS